MCNQAQELLSKVKKLIEISENNPIIEISLDKISMVDKNVQCIELLKPQSVQKGRVLLQIFSELHLGLLNDDVTKDIYMTKECPQILEPFVINLFYRTQYR